MKVFNRIDWNDSIDPILRDVTGYEHDEIKADVAANRSQLYEVDGSYLIVRIEGSELVIVGYIGDSAAENGEAFFELVNYTPDIESIRFHTQRKGLGRMMDRFGFTLCDTYYVYRRVKDGHAI